MNKTNFFKKVLFTLLFVSNFTFAGAYSLKDAVNSTLLNNEGLQIEKKKLEIAILEKPKAATEFLPSINIDLNKTFYNPNNAEDTPYNGKSSFNNESFGLSIQQDIFTGGSTIAKIASADAKINSAYQIYNKALNDMILKAIQNYQNVLTYRELVKVQQTNVDMAQKSVEKATITVKTGAETKTSLFLAKANLASMKSNFEDYSVGKTQAEAGFQYIVGEKAPNIILKDTSGAMFKLLAQKKDTILVFYRGSWCPYCINQLKSIETDVVKKLNPKTQQLVAISVDKNDVAAKMKRNFKFSFKIISDPMATSLKSYRIINKVSDELVEKYKNSYKIDIERDSGHHLPKG